MEIYYVGSLFTGALSLDDVTSVKRKSIHKTTYVYSRDARNSTRGGGGGVLG